MARNYKRDSKGRFARVNSARKKAAGRKTGLGSRPGAVAFSRTNLRSTTTGINAGVGLTKKTRISGGVYVKIQRNSPGRIEKTVRRSSQDFMNKWSERLAPHPSMQPYVKQALTTFRRNRIDDIIGGERQIGKKKFARITTDNNALPTLTIATKQKRMTRQKQVRSRKAMWAYNDMVMKGRKVASPAMPREQRRGRSA